jgi:hypothetical protein
MLAFKLVLEAQIVLALLLPLFIICLNRALLRFIWTGGPD